MPGVLFNKRRNPSQICIKRFLKKNKIRVPITPLTSFLIFMISTRWTSKRIDEWSFMNLVKEGLEGWYSFKTEYCSTTLWNDRRKSILTFYWIASTQLRRRNPCYLCLWDVVGFMSLFVICQHDRIESNRFSWHYSCDRIPFTFGPMVWWPKYLIPSVHCYNDTGIKIYSK